MAYITGSVTSFASLINNIKSSLINNGWSSVKDSESSRELFFNSPNNDVTIGFKVNTDNSTYYNLLLNTCNNFNGSNSFYSQVGSIPNYPDNSQVQTDVAPILTLHDNSMNFWFFINERRIIIVVKAGNAYVSAHLGKFLPYGSPNQYPKPFFCGSNGYDKKQLLSDSDSKNETFIYNKFKTSEGLSVLKNESMKWIKIRNTTNVLSGYGNIYPTNNNLSQLGKNSDNSYNLYPLILFSDTSAAGELEDIFVLSGLGLASENTITIDSQDYIVFNNVNKSTVADFFCVKKV